MAVPASSTADMGASTPGAKLLDLPEALLDVLYMEDTVSDARNYASHFEVVNPIAL